MSVTNGYCALAELKTRVGIGLAGADTLDDTAIETAIESASRGIDQWCGRRFWLDATATARTYRFAEPVARPGWAAVDDFTPATAPVVKSDDDDDGTFETTWTVGTDYQLEPLNPDVYEPGPQNRIRLVGGRCISRSLGRAQLQVTAKWGWPAVPISVKQACLILAYDLFKSKDAPFGVAGTTEMGVLRIRENPQVRQLLYNYRNVELEL